MTMAHHPGKPCRHYSASYTQRENAIRLLIFITLTVAALLQPTPPDSNTSLTADEPLTVRLTTAMPVELTYTSPGDEIITITAAATDPESLDVTLELRDSDDERVAFNDRHDGLDGLAFTDAALDRLYIEAAGTYTLVVDSFNGVTEGDVTVTLTTQNPVVALDWDGDSVTATVDLLPDRARSLTFDGTAGDTVTIIVRDPSALLDPRITLHDPDGAVIAANDDRPINSPMALTLNVFDSYLGVVELPVDGTYTLDIAEFLGRSGVVEVSITAE